MSSDTRTRVLIKPIIFAVYGKTGMTEALVDNLVQKIDSEDFDSRGREHMVMSVCWAWYSGGGTAEGVARRIEEALA